MKWLHRLLLFIFLLYFSFTYGKIKYNTIPTSLTRATPYIPKVVKKMCLLLPDEGPCRAGIDMYYFMPETMNCSTFRWGGCQGNGNRFDTIQECLGTCLSQPGERPYRPHYCKLRFDYGFCFGDEKRWFYDEKWNVCRETIYSGCGGNKNNFYTEEGCDAICRFGNGPPNVGRQSEANRKKVLIINPIDTTTQRGRDQKVTV